MAVLFGLAGVGLSSGGVLATTPTTPPTTTILAKSTFDELNIRAKASDWHAKLKTENKSDIYVVDNKFVPGAETGWHSHPGPSLVFVVSGTMTNYESDGEHCTKHVYSAGSNFVDAGGSDAHTLRNEGTTLAETIAVQLLPQGAPRKTDKPAPTNCSF
jgi:quercetin dioxygenase-like cupin family protein